MPKIVYLKQQRPSAPPSAIPAVPSLAEAALALPQSGPMLDRRQRPLRDLRISVTDRCNFRCPYCMPRSSFGPGHRFLPSADLLSFDDITRLATAFVALGTEKIRLTGGEPLLRPRLPELIERLSALRTPSGEPLELALTTNATLLAKHAADLHRAGLRRVTVSLDALDPDIFSRMTDARATPTDILRGIDAAANAGLAPVKINMVVRRGMNDDQIVPMARHFRGSGHIVRFIEFMDVGATNGWRMDDVITARDIVARIHDIFPLEKAAPTHRGEVAKRWRYTDGEGEIGVISSVSDPFCGDCTRARLSPEGRLFLCLFANAGHDLRTLARSDITADQLSAALAAIWGARNDNYSERRGSLPADTPRIEMSYIGG